MKKHRFHTHKKIVLIYRGPLILLGLGILSIAVLWLFRGCTGKPGERFFRTAGMTDLRIVSNRYPDYICTVDPTLRQELQSSPLAYETGSPMAQMPAVEVYTLSFYYEDGQEVSLSYAPILNRIYNDKRQQIKPSPQFKEKLLDLVAVYMQGVYWRYGVLMPWEEVEHIFPMFETAKIIDLETGQSFSVQRRAGSSHADAQPLTREDTAVMKKIYGGRWSWDRRGIIIEVKGHRIAASMNGMPHGGGKIDDNSFPGHFCIHFLGSTTHSGNMDIRHHQEILKAAGILPTEKQES